MVCPYENHLKMIIGGFHIHNASSDKDDVIVNGLKNSC